MPARAPAPLPTMIAVGVASPSAHGHAMTSTATARISEGRGVGRDPPARSERHERDREHDGHEDARNAIGKPLDGRLEPCASSTSLTMAASAVSAPTPVASALSSPPIVQCARRKRARPALWDRQTFACQHRLVHARFAFEHLSVDRYAFTGTHDEDIAHFTSATATSAVLPPRYDMRCPGLELESAPRLRPRLATSRVPRGAYP